MDTNMKNKISNTEYKQKYLKYKKKYLELKKTTHLNKSNNTENDGGGWESLLGPAMNFVKSNPTIAAGLAGTVMSGVSSSSSGLSNIALIGFKTFLSNSPQYQQLVRSGLMTPENEALMLELIKLEISHLADPSFYPIMANLIKNILILAASAETFNPVTIISALASLYSILNTLKAKYPKDFILLTTFLRANKDKIFHQIRARGINYPGLKTQFNMFMNLISVPVPSQNQPQMIQHPQQQMIQHPQQQTIQQPQQQMIQQPQQQMIQQPQQQIIPQPQQQIIPHP